MYVFLLYKTNRFHVALRLFSNTSSQRTSKCGKNISDTLGYRLVCHFFFYHNMRGINSSNDLLKTMYIGNELYSSLSQLARQSFLMLTELPTMLTVLDENYQLDYSASYTGTIHGDSAIDGFIYCMGLQRAL